jgi:SAM-dependent methyltransferase
MEKFVDAYGEQLWSYFKTGKPKNEIVERDDGFIAVGQYGGELYLSEYKDWAGIEKAAMKFVKGRVLDIGCGAGRHSLCLQSKGLDVTGIDNSPLAIKVSRARGLKKARVMPIEDIGKFKPDSFDTVIMLGNNFGLFGSFHKAKTLLKKLYKITPPGAVIVAASRDPYTTKDPVHLAYHKLNKRRGRMAGQLRLRVRYKNIIGNWFDYLIVSRQELKSILDGTGWEVRHFMDANDGQYIMVLSKK